ncbi:MAG: DUF4340 domain-containing protein [Bacteriovoracaceae bacterium]
MKSKAITDLEKPFLSLAPKLLVVLTLVVIILGLYTELFQLPKMEMSKSLSKNSPISSDLIDNLNVISFENKFGKFSFKKAHSNSDLAVPYFWKMTYPKEFASNQEIFQNIFSALKNLKIIKILPNDELNRSNYSINNPLLKIEMVSDYYSRTTLVLGLINSLDNSAYLHIMNQDFIYQVEALGFSFANITLSDFVNSQVLDVDTDQIIKVKIFKGLAKNGVVLNSFEKNSENGWKNLNIKSRSSLIDNADIESYLNKIFQIKAHTILDQLAPSLKNQLKQGLQNPEFSIVLQSESGEEYNFSFGFALNSPELLTQLKIEKNAHVVVYSENSEHYYLINKDLTDIFSTR